MSNRENVPRDTAPDAHAQQIAAYRRMDGEQRLLIGMRMSDELREVALSGIRSRHAEYDTDDARHALIRLLLGEQLYGAAYPGKEHHRP